MISWLENEIFFITSGPDFFPGEQSPSEIHLEEHIPLKLTLIEKGDKNRNSRVTSSESVSIYH